MSKNNADRGVKVSDFCDPNEAETYMRICGVDNLDAEMEEYKSLIEVVKRIENGEDVDPEIVSIVKALRDSSLNMKALAEPIDANETPTVVSALKRVIPNARKIIIVDDNNAAIEVHVTKPTDVMTLYLTDKDGNRLWFTKALNRYSGSARTVIL